MTKGLPAIFLIAAISAAAPAQADGDAKAGQVLFQERCVACHAAQPTRKPAPLLQGVYGRRAGTAPNYTYSAALRNASVTWDAQTLDKWLTDPPAFIPGVNMQAQVSAPQDRQNLIAYLKSISGNGQSRTMPISIIDVARGAPGALNSIVNDRSK
jgi:cytochrome c